MTSKTAIFVAILIAAAGLTAGISGYLIMTEKKTTTDNFMSSFSSYYDLARYLDESNSGGSNNTMYWDALSGSADQTEYARHEMGSADYSKTNVQVQGVDEADTIKTNGELLFIASWDSVAIVKVYPPNDMAVLSYVNVSSVSDNSTHYAYIQGIYITEDKLILVLSSYEIYYYEPGDGVRNGMEYSYWFYQNGNTLIAVFDISDPINPSLEQTYEITGYPITTRMIGDTVYAISQFYVWKIDDIYILPEITVGSSTEGIEVEEIYYDPNATSPDSFLNIMAVNVNELNSEHITVIADYSSTIYMSLSSLYLTFQKWNEGIVPLIDVGIMSEDSTYTTTIYKIEVDGLQMAVTARGDVRGYLLNQFSMDEHNGYLRVATTDGWWSNQKNAVYVLNGTLKQVGSLENIALNESIYSARFVNDTLYLVTFRQIDPLFVIDLSDPTNPHKLGEVEVTGFSTYLHPIDANHILGIGIENSSVKISLFDVTDPTAPFEEFRYVVSGYSYSSANWDHKAVLFDAEKELLVIPTTQEIVTGSDGVYINYTYIQAAFVFKVSVTDGITLRGSIDHEDRWVHRALYIGDYLYTVSDSLIKVNMLSDLSDMGSLEFYTPQYYGGNGTIVMFE